MKKINRTGKRYGKLLVLKEDGYIGNEIAWLCVCDCGNIKRIIGHNLGRGSNSCGCDRTSKLIGRTKTHGLSNNKLYIVWNGMKRRCSEPQYKAYEHYGGRGITVCEKWLKSFETFYSWAINNGYSNGLTLDRVNNDGDYSPENCRWVTQKEQNNNKRNNHLLTCDGKTMTMKQWSEKAGINYGTLRTRINELKWDVTKAIRTPTKERGNINAT